jgi:hypothetical protein
VKGYEITQHETWMEGGQNKSLTSFLFLHVAITSAFILGSITIEEDVRGK